MHTRNAPDRDRGIWTSLWLLILLPCQNALAHNSAAMYDDHQSVTVVGTVSRYVWANPHVYIYVAQEQGGRLVEWELEGSPPSILRRLGWSPSTLKPGDTITVVGRPAKNPMRKALLLMSIKLGNTMLFDRKTEVAQLSTAESVIDTARFSVNLVGDSYGLPSGTQKHLVERLTPSADGTSLTYHFELSDPEYLARPVSGDVTWLFRPNALYAPARCNLDIARRYTED